MNKIFNKLKSDYLNGEYTSDLEKPNGQPYPLTHVFDREQTVAWNESEVERLNAELEVKIRKYESDVKRLQQELHTDTMTASIQYAPTFDRKQINVIYNYVFGKPLQFVEKLELLEELIDMFEELTALTQGNADN